MYSTISCKAIATANENCSSTEAQTELEQYIEAQAQSVAPEFNPPTDSTAAKIRRLKYEAGRISSIFSKTVTRRTGFSLSLASMFAVSSGCSQNPLVLMSKGSCS